MASTVITSEVAVITPFLRSTCMYALASCVPPTSVPSLSVTGTSLAPMRLVVSA